MKCSSRTLLCCILFGFTTGLPVSLTAAEAGDQQLQGLIKQLKAQVDRAEQQRLADPWFLRDLRDLIAEYENPWRKEVLHDDFSSRERTPSEPWRITAGEFLIDWRYGMRSVIEPSRPKTESRDDGDGVEKLFGALLNEALDNGDDDEAYSSEPEYAAILAPIEFSNAFSIELELNSRALENEGGAFEWGPFIGKNASKGYRLVYTPDSSSGLPPLALHKGTPRGASTLEAYNKKIDLQDGQTHSFLWTRDTDGQMIVHLDGQPIIKVIDRSYQQPFNGFAIINQGGDYAVQEITILGTE